MLQSLRSDANQARLLRSRDLHAQYIADRRNAVTNGDRRKVAETGAAAAFDDGVFNAADQ